MQRLSPNNVDGLNTRIVKARNENNLKLMKKIALSVGVWPTVGSGKSAFRKKV
jgi:hypothetical protein